MQHRDWTRIHYVSNRLTIPGTTFFSGVNSTKTSRPQRKQGELSASSCIKALHSLGVDPFTRLLSGDYRKFFPPYHSNPNSCIRILRYMCTWNSFNCFYHYHEALLEGDFYMFSLIQEREREKMLECCMTML